MSESRKHSRDGADFDRAITDSLNSVGGWYGSISSVQHDAYQTEKCMLDTVQALKWRERSESDGRIRDQAEFAKTRWGLIKRRQDADEWADRPLLVRIMTMKMSFGLGS